MFDRFSDRARTLMGRARGEAVRFQHDFIGTEHLLLALLRDQSGAAVDLLKALGADPARLLEETERDIRPGMSPVEATGQVPFSSRARKVLEQTLEEMSALDHEAVSTPHVLLGILGVRGGVAFKMLKRHGVELEEARAIVRDTVGVSDSPHGPGRNVELKARCKDLARARSVVEDLGGRPAGVLEQTDTYFRARDGRLKLREIAGERAELIWYRRPDGADARVSDYVVAPVVDHPTLLRALGGALGIRRVVRKRREFLRWQNVRIHLDEVEDLGTFVELEAVLGPNDDEATGRERIERLRKLLGIRSRDRVAGSYGDLKR